MTCMQGSIIAYGLGSIISSIVIFIASGVAIYLGGPPLMQLIHRREEKYYRVLRAGLLLNVSPRSVTIYTAVVFVALTLLGYLLAGSFVGAVLGAAAGFMLPRMVLRYLQRKRLQRLDEQLISGVQTLASGVRAGLNLVQAMELLSRDGPRPLRQEFTHLLREYEFGMSLDEAMDNAAERIGSGNFRLLFSALQTHRQRGGDLGETLDRIARSIREIQRLESRVQTLTAQGRATARWLGAMPAVVLAILYVLVAPEDVKMLFVDDIGKLILLFIILLNVLGFLWIKKIISVDI